jgi:hypothetical protein
MFRNRSSDLEESMSISIRRTKVGRTAAGLVETRAGATVVGAGGVVGTVVKGVVDVELAELEEVVLLLLLVVVVVVGAAATTAGVVVVINCGGPVGSMTTI